jgi:class 3 adenylate cyclase/tetratricopeptide (TPR) repeat protein
MRCGGCGYVNPADAVFCEECGAALEMPCPNCGQALRAGAKFCKKCGHRLGAAPRSPADSSPAPRQYTPRHLAEQILTSRSALEGERKQVTVLFCDIVDSSGLAERLDPEVMHELMDTTLRLMAEAIHRYQGTVNQFLGDGLMALFGAPVALEDHALRAVQAALAIRETINGYSEQLKRERALEVRLRLGLNTGLVVVGRIGDDLRMDYTAVGDTTHLAARMQALAEPGAILITEATQRLVEGYIRSESLGAVQVKGHSEPVLTHRVIGRQPVRTRLELSAERGLTPLVGRDRELALLRERLERAKAGHGQVVGVMAEAGGGKSRLLYEFRASLEGERLTWLAANCVAYGQTTPYLPILEILRGNFQIEDEDNSLQIREKLRDGLGRLDPDLQPTLPFLGELLGLPAEDEPLRAMDAKDKRHKIFEAVRALTLAGSQRRPLVVILEDLHWIDKTSEDYIAFLVESLAGMPLLLLMTHRPGYAVRWAEKTYYTQITLDLLTESEAESMVATLLGSRRLPADLFPIIWQKAEGNPLFVEEVTRSLQERGLLARTDGEVRWARDAVVELPMTVQDIIRARIDGLEEPIKRTVQTAAVIGREFGLRILARISEVRGGLDRDLATLKHLELIHEKRFFPELEYIFKHAVTQDVAYQSLLLHRRKELHGAIGRAIEDLYADRLDEQAAILAYHYSRSDRQDKAMQYAVVTGDRAVRFYANTEAKSYYEQALSILKALPESPDNQRAEIDVVLKLAAVGATRQDIERDRLNLDRARGLAGALDDLPRLARVLYWLGRLHYVLGAFQQSLEYAGQSLDIADRLGDETLAAPPVNLMGRVYWNWTDFPRASKMLERSVEQMHRLGNKTEEATAAGIAGFVFGFMGEFDRASSYADRGLQLAQEIQNPFAEAAAYQYRASMREQQGDLAGALADYAKAREIAEGVGDRFRVYIIKIVEGRAHGLAGDPARGRALLDEAFVFAEQIGTKFFLAWQKTCTAGCLLALGDHEGALSRCQEAIGLGGETGERFIRALAQRIRAETLMRLDPSPENLGLAERALEEVIAVQREIGARPELGRTYASYAELLALKGETKRAAELAGQARSLFEELDLQWDLRRLAEARPNHPGEATR